MLAEIESWPSARFAPIPKYEPEAEPIFLPTLTAQADPLRTGPAPQDIACPSRVAVTQRADRAESRAESHGPRSGPAQQTTEKVTTFRSGPAQQDNGESHGPRSGPAQQDNGESHGPRSGPAQQDNGESHGPRSGPAQQDDGESHDPRSGPAQQDDGESHGPRSGPVQQDDGESHDPRSGPAQQDDGESHGLQAVEKDSPLPGASAPGPRHLAWPKLPTLTHQRLPLRTAIRCPRSRYPLTPVFPITCPQPQSLPHITREAPAKCPVSHT